MATLPELRQSLQRRIGEFSQYIGNETLGTGDGSKTTFYVKLPPISSDSMTVYQDDSTNSDYASNLDYGRIIFSTAPSSGVKISADYKGLSFHTDDLDDIITEAVEDLYKKYTVREFSISGSSVSPTPNRAEERLLIQQSLVNFLDSLSVRLSMDAIRTSQTGFSMDTTARAKAIADLRSKFDSDLDKNISSVLNDNVYSDNKGDWLL